MKEKYCHYCSKYRPDEGFLLRRAATGPARYICPICQERRSQPYAVLLKQAQEEKEVRRKAMALQRIRNGTN